MVRVLLMLVAIAAASGCAARDVEEEGESRRHLAAEWCEDYCGFLHDCDLRYAGRDPAACRDSCESDEAWDWTDECGDLKWAYRECKETQTCEDVRRNEEVANTTPLCQEYFNDFVQHGCSYE